MMSPRSRRRLVRSATAFGTVAAIAVLASLIYIHRPPANTDFNVVAVEPRQPAATTEADLAAELSTVTHDGGQLLVTEIADQTAAPALDVDLGCPSSLDPISCQQLQQQQTAQAETVADRLAAAPRPARVDVYAVFSQVSGYLSEHPSARHRTINVYINTMVDATTPANLASANLADPATVATLAAEGVSQGGFPGAGDCAGWQVHMVVPATADPAHDLGLRHLLTRLVTGCGGTVASWTPRWIAPAGTTLALPPIPGAQTIPDPGPQVQGWSIPDTLFGVGSADITADGRTALTALATNILAQDPGRPFECLGSADGTGGSSPAALAYDRTLSEDRAAAVCGYLVQQGLGADLARPRGLGQTTARPDPSRRNVMVTVDTGAAS